MMNRNCIGLLVFMVACQPSADEIVRLGMRLEDSGAFQEADSLYAKALERESDSSEVRRLLFERERLNRIRADYKYTEDQIWDQVSRRVRDVSREEFDAWVAEGKFDTRSIDGRKRFLAPSVSNLFWRNADIRERQTQRWDNAQFSKDLLKNVRSIVGASREARKPFVLPKMFRVMMRVRMSPNVAPDGIVVKAWLPIPREMPFQTGPQDVVGSSAVTLDDPASPIRSAYLEQTVNRDSSTVFQVEFGYTHHGVHFDIDPDDERPIDTTREDLAPFLREGPHVVFSEAMRSVSSKIVGSASSRVERAKAIYTWMTDSIAYSYAAEYSTIRNIGANCLEKMAGDCGQEALLFITLCRLNGIPARWQSGWFTFPGGKTIHDWVSIYLEPWGWVPVDPYMGVFAKRYLTGLTEGERSEIRDFYFGGLDQFRIAANADHCQDLRPAKRSFRSDDVDFQRGELEWGTTNIYFDKYSYRLDIEEVSGVY